MLLIGNHRSSWLSILVAVSVRDGVGCQALVEVHYKRYSALASIFLVAKVSSNVVCELEGLRSATLKRVKRAITCCVLSPLKPIHGSK